MSDVFIASKLTVYPEQDQKSQYTVCECVKLVTVHGHAHSLPVEVVHYPVSLHACRPTVPCEPCIIIGYNALPTPIMHCTLPPPTERQMSQDNEDMQKRYSMIARHLLNKTKDARIHYEHTKSYHNVRHNTESSICTVINHSQHQ